LVSRALGGGCFWFACKSLYLIHGCFFGCSAYTETCFLCMLLFKSSNLAFLVLAKILCVLNKFHFIFLKKNTLNLNYQHIHCGGWSCKLLNSDKSWNTGNNLMTTHMIFLLETLLKRVELIKNCPVIMT